MDTLEKIDQIMKPIVRKNSVEYVFQASEKILPRESCQGKNTIGAERVARSRLLVCGGIVDRIKR